MSSPARSAGTLPTHWVTASIVLTYTLHLASLTETSTWACYTRKRLFKTSGLIYHKKLHQTTQKHSKFPWQFLYCDSAVKWGFKSQLAEIELYLCFSVKIFPRWFSDCWMILVNDLGEKLLLCLLELFPNFTTASLNIPQCCLLLWKLSQKCSLHILTVLAESSHESWRTVAWPVMFITHTTIFTSGAGFCAAWTPETLQTHWKIGHKYF